MIKRVNDVQGTQPPSKDVVTKWDYTHNEQGDVRVNRNCL